MTVTGMMPLQVQVFTTMAAVTPDTRSVSGVIAQFGVRSSDGRVFDPGSITSRFPLSRVKLLVDHKQSRPIGYLTQLDIDAAEARATFHIPPSPRGDRALQRAIDKVRDGFSVGLAVDPADYYFDHDDVLHVRRGELVESSLVSVPAFQGTQVENVAAALAAYREQETIRMTTTAPPAPAGTDTPPAPPDTQPAPPAVAPAPQLQAAALLPAVHPQAPAVPAEFQAGPDGSRPHTPTQTANRPWTLQAAALHISEAIRSNNRGLIMAAIQDVLPTDDLGQGFIGREDWIGQVWQATRQGRPWIDSFGPTKPLNATKIKGWAWNVRPKPAKYAGLKADVPSNKPTTKPVEATPERWAGGWDIDRILIDLGDPSFLTEFWNAAALEYQIDSDTDIAVKVVAGATAFTAGTSVIGTISAAAAELRSIGGTLSQVWLAEDVFTEYTELKTTEVPFWLANSVGGVDLEAGTASVGSLSIDVDPTGTLTAGQVVAYDSRAASVYEKAPFQVTAVDVARGGVDLGFYSYGGILVHDARAILKTTYVPAPPAGARASSK